MCVSSDGRGEGTNSISSWGCKIIYNQHSHRSLSHHSPLEIHHSNSTLDIFRKQYPNKTFVRKRKLNVGDTDRINETSNILKSGITFSSSELFKVSKSFKNI